MDSIEGGEDEEEKKQEEKEQGEENEAEEQEKQMRKHMGVKEDKAAQYAKRGQEK